MWPGSEVPGLGATYIDKYNGSEPLPQKISKIISYLDLPFAFRPRLVAAYIPDIDAAGHKFGPNSTESTAALKAVDSAIAQLSGSLAARNLTDIVNIILVSDHGMASTSSSRLIHLSSLVNTSQIEHTDGWPLFALRPYPSESIPSILADIQSKHTNSSPWDVYTPSTFPAKYNFSSPSNPRYKKRPHQRIMIIISMNPSRMINPPFLWHLLIRDYRPAGFWHDPDWCVARVGG